MEKENIRKQILEYGADVCGFGDVGKLDACPLGFSPIDIFPRCKSVIAIGVALPQGLFEIENGLIYGYFNQSMCGKVDEISFRCAKFLEDEYDAASVPIPCDSPYEYWDEKNSEGRGLVSMKHMGVLCGIGQIGKSSLLLSPQFGNRLIIGCVLTEMELASDPSSESVCLDSCTRCVDACPKGAIRNGQVQQKLCRQQAYVKTARGFEKVQCNKCRALCPGKYGTKRR